MKSYPSAYFIALFTLLLLTFSCKKEAVEKQFPQLSSGTVTDITATTARFAGEVSQDGGATVTARGTCWSINQFPSISDSKTTDGSGIGGFTSSLTGLTPSTTYYIRIYATNSVGTSYTDPLSFKTISTIPSISTTTITNITMDSAISGGSISSDGGSSVTARGICWSMNQLPTITNGKTIDGTGTGAFTSSITGLYPATKYYVRAYATNSAGTGYGNEIAFKSLEPSIGTVTDTDGNVYHTVTIGTQVWMKENLKTTKFNDGVNIPYVTDNFAWGNMVTPGFCWYNNEIANKNIYGALYNWYTVNTGKLAPIGWHVPTDAEWTTLTTYLGGESIAGGKLKETGTSHWLSPNTGTNETGFTALPGGNRYPNGTFNNIGNLGYWWSSTEEVPIIAKGRGMYSGNSTVVRDGYYKNGGFSVRCVRD